MKYFPHMKKEDYVKICPHCGSLNIGGDYLNDFCKDCGLGLLGAKPYTAKEYIIYNNNFPEIKKNKTNDFRKELKKALIKKQSKSKN